VAPGQSLTKKGGQFKGFRRGCPKLPGPVAAALYDEWSKPGGQNRSRILQAHCLCDPKETDMSSTSDKIKGTAKEVTGKVKQSVGDATDNSRMKGEGRTQEAEGKLQKNVGKGKEAVKDTIDRA